MGRGIRGREWDDIDGSGTGCSLIEQMPGAPSGPVLASADESECCIKPILFGSPRFRPRPGLSGQRKHVDVVGPSQTAVSFLGHHPVQLHQILHVSHESPRQLPTLPRAKSPSCPSVPPP